MGAAPVRPSARQSRCMSAIEAVTNMAVGLVLAVVTQIVCFPSLGLALSFGDHVQLAGRFTLVSLLRGYALRRPCAARARAGPRCARPCRGTPTVSPPT